MQLYPEIRAVVDAVHARSFSDIGVQAACRAHAAGSLRHGRHDLADVRASAPILTAGPCSADSHTELGDGQHLRMASVWERSGELCRGIGVGQHGHAGP